MSLWLIIIVVGTVAGLSDFVGSAVLLPMIIGRRNRARAALEGQRRRTAPYRWTAPEDRRGQLLHVAVITCHKCLDDVAQPLISNYHGIEGWHGDEAKRAGWVFFEEKYWLCPACAEHVRAFAREALL